MMKYSLFIMGIMFVAGVLGNLTGLWVTAVLFTLLLLAWKYTDWAYIRVPEMQVAVVYNTERQAFVRFLPPGRHRITPFVERVEAAISTAPNSIKGHSKGVQTIGGIALNIEWALSYNLNPFKATAVSHPKLARSLPHKSGHIAEKYLNNCLQHIIGEYTIQHLTQPGSHKRLERQVQQLLAQRLASLGFEIGSVMIGAIEMPPYVKKALEAAHEQHLQMETEATGLARMQQVISQFSEADMKRLMELERIYKMGKNGVTLVYPAVTSDREANPYPPRSQNNTVVTS
jgi:hypothetical protein